MGAARSSLGRPRDRRGVGRRRAEDGPLRGRRPAARGLRRALWLSRDGGRRPGWRCATTAARAFARATTRPRSTSSASSARRRFTTSPRPTESSKSSSDAQGAGALGSSASRRSSSFGPAAASSPEPTTSAAARASRLPLAARGARAPAGDPERMTDRSRHPRRGPQSVSQRLAAERRSARIGPDPA